MISIVTALRCEALPLIDHYRLHHDGSHSQFHHYRNDEIQLIISGVGKLAAATATAYLAASTQQQCIAWLNLGIAGHADRAIGKPLLADRIIDAASGQRWYPGFALSFLCGSDSLTTIDQPDDTYNRSTMVDMEASGFFAAASRFQSCELIHALKIISDNRTLGTEHINKKMVSGLIAENLETIENTVSNLLQLAAQLAQIEQPPGNFYEFLERWHFTTYQQNELRNQLLRWRALLPHRPPSPADFGELGSSKSVLSAIKTHLDLQPINFDVTNR